MPADVAAAATATKIDFGVPVLEFRAGNFRDAFETISSARTTAYRVLRSAAKASRSMPAVNYRDGVDVFRDIAELWTEFLETMDRIAQDAVAE